MVVFLKSLQRLQIPRIAVVLLLLGLLIVSAAPSYLTGQWTWTRPPQVSNLKQLKALKKTGLALPGWQIVEHKAVTIGGHKWLAQQVKRGTEPNVLLLLRPQDGPTDQPEIDWIDVDGVQRWSTDSYQSVRFTVDPKTAVTATQDTELVGSQPNRDRPVTVEARFFRGWTAKQTYAVLQWYALAQGGTASPTRWFFADRIAQWQKRRVAWVGVSILMPIEPLEDIEKYWSSVQGLGQTIQLELMRTALN